MIKLYIIMLFGSLGLLAGKGEYTVYSNIQTVPEYIEFNISVRSKCFYDIPKLNESHNKYLNDFIAVLEKENINIHSSYFSSYSYNGRDENNNYKTYCEGSYQKITDITYTIKDIAQFSNAIAVIYQQTNQIFNGLSGDEKSPSTTVKIGTACAQITECTRERLYCDALNKAKKTALERCKAEFPGSSKHVITSVIEVNSEVNDGHYSREKSMQLAYSDKVEYGISPVTVSVARHYEIMFSDDEAEAEDSDDT